MDYTMEEKLFDAAESGDTETVQALVKAGAKIETRGKKKMTPLFVATQNRHTKTVQALLEAGADPEARNKYEKTPLDIAIAQKYEEIALLLGKAIKRKREAERAQSSNTPIKVAGGSFVVHGNSAGTTKPAGDAVVMHYIGWNNSKVNQG